MRADDLIEALKGYPPSHRAALMAKGHHMQDTTVAEIICSLMGLPSDESITFFGLTSLIIRERTEETGSRPKRWLEIDAR